MITNVGAVGRSVELSAAPVTPEPLLAMPDGDRYELIDGKLVKRNSGAESNHIAATIMRLLGNHVAARRLRPVFGPDRGYQIFSDHPNPVRFPDGSFIGRGRLPDERVPDGHIKIPPDLAVEVVSPNDTPEEVEAKRVEYRRAGMDVLWIIYPGARTVRVHRKEGQASFLDEKDELRGEGTLQGFACKVSELCEGLREQAFA
jgi:Uma2 family endonuclease